MNTSNTRWYYRTRRVVNVAIWILTVAMVAVWAIVLNELLRN